MPRDALLARTYGCVRLIEAALKRPVHHPVTVKPHLADEYEDRFHHHPDRGGKDARELRDVASELRRPLRWIVPVSPTPLGRD